MKAQIQHHPNAHPPVSIFISRFALPCGLPHLYLAMHHAESTSKSDAVFDISYYPTSSPWPHFILYFSRLWKRLKHILAQTAAQQSIGESAKSGGKSAQRWILEFQSAFRKAQFSRFLRSRHRSCSKCASHASQSTEKFTKARRGETHHASG